MSPELTPAQALRHPLALAGLGLLRAAIALPHRLQLRLGALLGSLFYLASPRRRRVAAVNLELCFPEATPRERRALLRAHFRHLGVAVLETGMAWWAPPRRLRPLAQVEGLEHLEAAQARGRGVIILAAHVTCLEIGARLLALHHPMAVVYRPHGHPLLEAVTRRYRDLRTLRAIPRGDMRALARALRAGLAVWYAPDQNFRRHAVFAPFMGVPAATLTATARLARMTGAAVVPFQVWRREKEGDYALRLLPALEGFPSGDEAADAARVNAVVEAQVARAPAQYLWVHRRFKTRPPGEADPYAD